jgi:integrase
MLARRRTLKSGKVWVGFYYDGRDEHGKRVELPLGTDLAEAKAKWAELERKPPPAGAKSRMAMAWDKYAKDVMPTKAAKTQREQGHEIARLQAYFRGAEFEQITPAHVAQYRDGRKTKARELADGTKLPAKAAPVAANRELALFSHFWNKAREWGYTQATNPCAGVSKNRETPREFYADAEVWAAVRNAAAPELRDAMDLAYLSGQRPADVLRFNERDLVDDALQLKQGKTAKRLRILLTDQDTGQRSELGQLVDRLRARTVRSAWLINTPEGQPMSMGMLRLRFNAARAAAATQALANNQPGLADRIKAFQFRDARPKAASEIANLADAAALLGHSDKQITKTVYRRVGERVKPTR